MLYNKFGIIWYYTTQSAKIPIIHTHNLHLHLHLSMEHTHFCLEIVGSIDSREVLDEFLVQNRLVHHNTSPTGSEHHSYSYHTIRCLLRGLDRDGATSDRGDDQREEIFFMYVVSSLDSGGNEDKCR